MLGIDVYFPRNLVVGLVGGHTLAPSLFHICLVPCVEFCVIYAFLHWLL